MDIYEYAMNMEKDGESFYRELAAETRNQGLKSILIMLADAEVRHYGLFRNMKQHGSPSKNMEELSYIKNIFQILKEEKQFNIQTSQMELYRKAQDLEKQTRDFYLTESKKVDEPQRAAFSAIAAEEQRHYLILEDIIKMVDVIIWKNIKDS
jgi:rubrerythrin